MDRRIRQRESTLKKLNRIEKQLKIAVENLNELQKEISILKSELKHSVVDIVKKPCNCADKNIIINFSPTVNNEIKNNNI